MRSAWPGTSATSSPSPATRSCWRTLTAATSPLAAFAGLSVGLLVLRMNRQMASGTTQLLNGSAARPLTAAGAGAGGNGHLAPALSAARAALAAAGTLRSCRTRAQLRLLTTGLRQYRGCAAVRDFLDEHGTGR